MKKSKLIEILSTFSKQEIKAFEKFIRSPYFNIGRDVTGLFSFLKKHYPDYESGEIKKENIFKNLFPGEKYNGKKLKNLSFDLTRLAEQFLIYDYMKSDPVENERILAIQYKERGRDKLFFSAVKSLENKVMAVPFDSVTCFSMEEKVVRLKEEFYIGKNLFPEAITLRSKYTEYFTLSFLVLFLRKLRDKEVINLGYNTPFENILSYSMSEGIDFKKILLLLKKKKYSMLWMVEMYYYAFLSAKNLDDEKSFYKFKRLFYENMEKFSRREKYFILSDFLSFYVRNENRGKLKYEQEEFEVYKQMLEQGAYSSSGKEHFNTILYRNMMFLALSLKEHKWLDRLIKEFTGKLKPEYRDCMKNLARAHLDFAMGNLEEALDSIIKVKYDLLPNKFDIKNLSLKIYYDLDLLDTAFSLVDTYKHFLKKTESFPPPYMLQFQNFIGIYAKLLKAKSDGKKDGVKLILSEVKSAKSLSSRRWILEKISELEKGK